MKQRKWIDVLHVEGVEGVRCYISIFSGIYL